MDLEVDLPSELEDSRVKRRGVLSKAGVTKVGIHGVELSMVPRVEGFQTQFEAAAAGFAQ